MNVDLRSAGGRPRGRDAFAHAPCDLEGGGWLMRTGLCGPDAVLLYKVDCLLSRTSVELPARCVGAVDFAKALTLSLDCLWWCCNDSGREE